jgi:deazaflavin-dependent oxidoreductase (nitroreductase family)
MPLPRTVGKLNKAGLNRLTRHIAPWAPGMGLIVHRGRRSGRRYETPVQVFPVEDGYVIALTYGPGADWTKNVLAAGGCELHTRGRTVQLTQPRLYQDQTRQRIRPAERQMLRLLRVTDFLELKTVVPPAANQ